MSALRLLAQSKCSRVDSLSELQEILTSARKETMSEIETAVLLFKGMVSDLPDEEKAHCDQAREAAKKLMVSESAAVGVILAAFEKIEEFSK